MTRHLICIVAATSLLAGCSSAPDSTEAANDDAITTRVVTSTTVWGDVANVVLAGQDTISVRPIISGQDIDPHSYEPTAADMALVEDADVLVAGGGHYDLWLTEAAMDTDAKVIVALDEDEQVENEHIWYDTDALEEVAEELADAVGAGDPDAVDERVDEIKKAKSKVGEIRVAQTHPLADGILDGTDAIEATPEGFRKATLAESTPSARDVQAFLELIDSGDLDVLIDSPQTTDQVSKRLRETAEAKGIPVVEVYETPAEGQNFFDLYLQTVQALQAIDE
ncbi:zinc ABC transporter substrate-binding protein [Corynebacterium sp. TAE3-ERU12]|uniref:metal ABC transporter solute-binding protein, Zn/Mn family n=1 Tax=Corynebacterium sp. TAE3-ERU12 TaxID=2849491 RepID=UPI001C46BCBF|nr:zinc ABC transporter substrate-binding protein [Corynebacterium sp. TAE3-ERU12]MBV7295892.1 zinc ABC transporter substrate-binding protein [Corynebacterium sp. TAE3-ERU12]